MADASPLTINFVVNRSVNFEFTLCKKVNKVLTSRVIASLILAAAAATISVPDLPKGEARPAVVHASASATIVTAARITFSPALLVRASASTGEARRLVEFQ